MADNDTMINVEEYGFTEEDIKNAGVEVNTDDGKTEEPAAVSTEGNPQTEAEPQAEPVQEDNHGEAVDHDDKQEEPNHGDLNNALKEERSRRKAMKAELDEMRAKYEALQRASQAPTVPPETMAQITEQAKAKAKALMGVQDETELMFSDPKKYAKYVREVARAEVHATDAYNARQKVYAENVAFVNTLKNTPDFGAIWNKGVEVLNGMTYGEAMPINQAFANVDRGAGSQADFKTISDFVSKVKGMMASPAPVKESPIESVKNLPKAQSLNGGGKTAPKISNEEILKAYREGRESDLPKEIRDEINKLIG